MVCRRRNRDLLGPDFQRRGGEYVIRCVCERTYVPLELDLFFSGLFLGSLIVSLKCSRVVVKAGVKMFGAMTNPFSIFAYADSDGLVC